MYRVTDRMRPITGVIMGTFLPFLSLQGPMNKTKMTEGMFSIKEAYMFKLLTYFCMSVECSDSMVWFWGPQSDEFRWKFTMQTLLRYKFCTTILCQSDSISCWLSKMEPKTYIKYLDHRGKQIEKPNRFYCNSVLVLPLLYQLDLVLHFFLPDLYGIHKLESDTVLNPKIHTPWVLK